MSDEEDEERWEREDAERKQRNFAAAIVAFREQRGVLLSAIRMADSSCAGKLSSGIRWAPPTGGLVDPRPGVRPS